MPRRRAATGIEAEFYKHPESESLLRPDVGTQAQFRKKKPPQQYKYDSSLSPELQWDGQNAAREEAEQRIATAIEQLSQVRKKISEADIEKIVADNPNLARDAVLRMVAENLDDADEALRELKAMSGPFLNWARKAERLSFEVPTLPLFVHERLSTKAILETLKGHTRDRQTDMFQFFGDPQHSVTDQILGAYEHTDKWVNRIILGDSLVVMNSLLRYEFLGEQVQMIYIDPPYGVKFGSNFQPFVRKRDVKHNDDEDLTREPEMVQAYRDTWELGLHSYLTYLRDRLFLARDLLTISGSIFVQIGDENVHHVREIMDEVFGPENSVAVIPFVKTSGKGGADLDTVNDYLLWYAKTKELMKYRQLYHERSQRSLDQGYTWIELPDSTRRRLTAAELRGEEPMPIGRRFISAPLNSQSGGENARFEVELNGRKYVPTVGYWKTNKEGMESLKHANRLLGVKNTLAYVRYEDDFPVV